MSVICSALLPCHVRTFKASLISKHPLIVNYGLKERHKTTYKPNHEFSRFVLICDKQTELSECARCSCNKRSIVVAEERTEQMRSVANVPNNPLWSQTYTLKDIYSRLALFPVDLFNGYSTRTTMYFQIIHLGGIFFSIFFIKNSHSWQ